MTVEGGQAVFSSWDYEEIAAEIFLCGVLSPEGGQAVEAVGTRGRLFPAVGIMRTLRKKFFRVESCHLKGGQVVEAVETRGRSFQ